MPAGARTLADMTTPHERIPDRTAAFGEEPAVRHRHLDEASGVAPVHPQPEGRPGTRPPLAAEAPETAPLRTRFGDAEA